jgi:hypothetical protein
MKSEGEGGERSVYVKVVEDIVVDGEDTRCAVCARGCRLCGCGCVAVVAGCPHPSINQIIDIVMKENEVKVTDRLEHFRRERFVKVRIKRLEGGWRGGVRCPKSALRRWAKEYIYFTKFY